LLLPSLASVQVLPPPGLPPPAACVHQAARCCIRPAATLFCDVCRIKMATKAAGMTYAKCRPVPQRVGPCQRRGPTVAPPAWEGAPCCTST
jgi:hypothetical protein